MLRLAAFAPVAIGLAVSLPLLRFLLLPLLPFLEPGVAPPPGDGPGLGEAIGNTVRLATAAAACAVLPAVWLSMLLERRAWAGRRVLAGTLFLVFLLPGYLVAAGWQIVLGWNVLGAVSWLRAGLLGWPGLVGLTALKALPVATFAARGGWIVCRPRLDEATRIHVRNPWRRAMLSVRPVLPAAATAFLIVFVEATQEYGLAATLGAGLRLPLLVTEVYASLAAWPISWSRAALAGDTLVLVALAPLAVQLLFRTRTAPLLDRGLAPALRAASHLERVFAWLTIAAILAIGCGVPLVALASDAVLPGAGTRLDTAWHALLISTLYGFVGALAAVGLACALVSSQPRPGWRGMLAWLPLVNLAVPGVVLGAAEIIAYNGPPLALVGTPLALLLAQTATQMPLMALILRTPIRGQSGVLGDAARVHGIPLGTRIECIHLPPLLRPLAWAWSLAFSRLFFELPLAQMLAPAGGEPVAVALLQLQQGMRFASEAHLAIAAVLLCCAIIGAVLLLAERLR